MYDFGGVPVSEMTAVSSYRPGLMARAISKIVGILGCFILKRVFGLQYAEPKVRETLDKHLELEISPAEVIAGGEKQVTYGHGRRKKKLMVNILPGVKTDTKIRLKNVGYLKGNRSGDLYLHMKAKK